MGYSKLFFVSSNGDFYSKNTLCNGDFCILSILVIIDDAERNYEFSYDGLDRKRYQVENRAIYTQQRAERGERNAKEMGKAPELTIHLMILKAAVPDEAYTQWSEAVKDPSKRAEVKPSGRELSAICRQASTSNV